VNPSLEKGVYAFAQIASELSRHRPDIPLMVVESRGTRDTLESCGLNPDAYDNIRFMPNTADPRQFWSLTRIALMPSLWWETQGLVAIEAMINGIPVIGSDRGSIPETLGEAGLLLSLPDRLTPESRSLPTAEEVEPWVETITRLWDDRALYDEHRARSWKESERWHPDRLRPRYTEFFSNVSPQPGPPFIPGRGKEERGGLVVSEPDFGSREEIRGVTGETTNR
jgi:glycosyltransferase involved in cell wall biosynthesis